MAEENEVWPDASNAFGSAPFEIAFLTPSRSHCLVAFQKSSCGFA